MKQSATKREKQLLSMKQKRFVAEYMVDFNATRAATAAGYKQPNVVGCQMMNHPLVAKEIARAQKKAAEKIEVSKEKVLEQLYFLLTRDAEEFVDEDGVILPIKKMSKRARSVIDGFEQEVYYDDEGGKTVKTKIRLSGKATAVDLAMKHKGLIAVTKAQVDVTAKLDLSALVGRPQNPAAEIEGKILEIESESEEGE